MTRHDPETRDAQRVVNALADLFDAQAPHDRAAAEEELRDAGLDPQVVGARFARLARPDTDELARRPRRVAPGATPAAPRRRLLQGAIAALVVGGFAWLLGGDAVLRSTWHAPQPPASDQERSLSTRPRPAPQLGPRSRSAEGFAKPAAATPGIAATPPPARLPLPQSEWAAPLPPDGDALDQPGSEAITGADGAPGRRGWILDSNNWQQAEGMLPPAVLERIKKGDYWYQVVPVDPHALRANYSKKFWAATQSNAGKFDVDPGTCGLKDLATGSMPEFYFGYPFPTIDAKDPLAGCKIAWNFDAASSMGEGQGATFTLNGVDTTGEFKRIKLWLHTLAFLGRHGGPIDNPEGLRAASLSNVLEPQDVDAVGGLSKRVNDWDSQDKIWFYVPATRRVRRVNAATRSDPVAGLDLFADDLNCYGGKIESYKWKLIGEQTILAPLLSPRPFAQEPTNSPSRSEVTIPYLKAAYETPGAAGVPWLVIENLVLVPRPVWVLQGESTDPYYNLGKVIMYMDRDLYRIYWKIAYNRAGEYFYNAMCGYHFSKSDRESFSAVSPSVVVGVNDKTNRACLAGRYSSQFIERRYPDDYFSLRSLTRLSE